MSDPLFIRVLHLLGVMILFLSLGGVLALQGNANPPSRKLVAIFHGIGLLVLFLTGFALIGILKIGFPLWVILKIIVWLLMGGMLVLGKRRIVSTAAIWIIVLVLGFTAAYLGVKKPFQKVPDPETAKVSVVEAPATRSR